jgi:hypothetical protein
MSQGVGADRDYSLDRGDVLHGLNGLVASSGVPVKLSVQEDKRRWYCVCSRCGAKAFSVRKSFACPRCSSRLRAREQILPPWHR